jgi:hypothetical protein
MYPARQKTRYSSFLNEVFSMESTSSRARGLFQQAPRAVRDLKVATVAVFKSEEDRLSARQEILLPNLDVLFHFGIYDTHNRSYRKLQ